MYGDGDENKVILQRARRIKNKNEKQQQGIRQGRGLHRELRFLFLAKQSTYGTTSCKSTNDTG